MQLPTEAELTRMLELVQKEVFMRSDAAFMGSLMCSHEIIWDWEGKVTKTAAVTGNLKIYWHPEDFMRCTQSEREATLLHELWHTGLMHHARRGNRDPFFWNLACDYRINNNLISDGYKLTNPNNWIHDRQFDFPHKLGEEEIYDKINNPHYKPPPSFNSDLLLPDDDQINGTGNGNSIEAVVRAVQSALTAGKPGAIPGGLVEILDTFLNPVMDWKVLLQQWMRDLSDEAGDYSWSRPNRRYQNIYLPAKAPEEGRLEHIVYFQDTSGSITSEDMKRFNSEVRYVLEQLKPKKLTVVQFDTMIQHTQVFRDGDPFEDISIHGGGGTNLTPVKEWIEKHQPTGAVIFTDLFCEMMQPPKANCPILWAVINNPKAVVRTGKIVHIPAG